MLKTGLLNPHVLSLLARVRHTNALVIADRGFPFWPMIETVDLSLVDGVPTVLQVLEAIRRDYVALGTVAVARPLTERVALKLQLDGHSSFYDSGLAGLGSSAVQLTVGGQIDLSRGSSLDLGLVENLFTDTTPDLVFHFALRSVL